MKTTALLSTLLLSVSLTLPLTANSQATGTPAPQADTAKAEATSAQKSDEKADAKAETAEKTADKADDKASADTKTDEKSDATAETAKAETAKTETKEEPKKEKLTAIPVSGQVAKLMSLYPSLVARISPLGKVCFDGGECDINIAVLAPAVDGQPRDGESIYNAICKTCHGVGLIGAPKFGNAGDWGPRIAKGKDTLYDHAINGFNAMPAKGGADIADEEVKNAVDYMTSKSS